MAEGGDPVPTDALEDVAYLARSANRFAILDALTEGPATRREVAERTGASRTTLDRIVNELEDRGWAGRTADGDYVATPTGSHVMAQLRPCVDAVDAVRRLDETVDWLPDDLSIGLQHFSDATVRRPGGDDPMETVDYFTDLVGDTAELRVLTHFAPPVPLSRAMRDRIVAGRLTAEYLVADEAIEYLRDRPERRDRWLDILDGGGALFRVQEAIPCNLFLFDDIVLIKKSGPGSVPDSYGVPIESENETVRAWAHDLIDRHRDDATQVSAGQFAAKSPTPGDEHGDE